MREHVLRCRNLQPMPIISIQLLEWKTLLSGVTRQGNGPNIELIVFCQARESMQNEIELYKKVVNSLGNKSQLGMAIEECAELIVAIRHYSRGRATIKDVAQEVADVEIMCGQLREMIGTDIVTQCKEEKLIRLKQIVEKWE